MKHLPWFALLMAFGLFLPGAANAGCQINIFVENTGIYAVDVRTGTNGTGVKTKGGSWRKLTSGNWRLMGDETIEAGEQRGNRYNAVFGCGKNRRYRIKYYCKGGANERSHFTSYYPSPTEWTKKVDEVVIKLDKCV
jgi:hypothetical protein